MEDCASNLNKQNLRGGGNGKHTSVPIRVGRIYRLAEVEYGTHSCSTSTSLRMHSNSSFWSKDWEGKDREKRKWRSKAGTLLVFTDPHATGNTSSGYATVTCCRGSHLPWAHSSQNLISHGLSYCAFLCSTPNDLLCSKVSPWDGKKEPLTLLASKACGELPVQPTQPGMGKLQQQLSYRRLWFTTPRGQQVSQSSQVLRAIKLISLGGSPLAKIQLLKAALSYWHDQNQTHSRGLTT